MRLSDSEVTWYKALHICRTMGGQLLKVTDNAMLHVISKKLRNRENSNYWIDLSDHRSTNVIDTRNVTSLTTGKAPDFVQWCDRQQPKKDSRCVYVENSNKPCMKLSSCKVYHNYVCVPDKGPKSVSIIVY